VVFFLCLSLFGIFLLENLIKKTINYSSGSKEDIEVAYERFMSTLDNMPKLPFFLLMYKLGQ